MKVLFISMTGIMVVFAFLFFLYLILLLVKKIFYKEKTEVQKDKIVKSNDIPEEVVVTILTTLKKYRNRDLNNKKVSITKRRS
ncbi:MAG: OadG family protein [Halanaerobiales bacterium]|nr:OadG family protein [Halanaerobiales bacterium]